VDVGQGLAQGLSHPVLTEKIVHGVQAAVDGGRVAPGFAQAAFQEPRAQGRDGAVQDLEQGALAGPSVQAAEDFQVALGDLVQDQAPGQIQGPEPGHVRDVLLLGLAQVEEERAAGPGQLGLVLQAQGGQIGHGLHLQEAAAGRVQVKGPALGQGHGLGSGIREGRRRLASLGQQEFARPELGQPLPEFGLARGGKPAPLARGDLGPGQATPLAGLVPV
jgi:hypothetical protein